MRNNTFKDFVGAFADGGILFPLLVMLSFQGSFSAPMLFACAGLAYLISAWIFKIPMAVQPLKAIAIAAVAIGASGLEIRLSGLLLGVLCLVICFTLTLNQVDRWAKKIPSSVIHSVQLGLGVLLFTQGVGVIGAASPIKIGITSVLFILVCSFPSYSLLGILAVAGLLMTLFFPELLSPLHASHVAPVSGIRSAIVFSLVLPQLALTLTNSVVATVDVAKRYYGDRASRVTERHLLLSIGVGNIISAVVGGLPYCHGSGGMTAHYRGGARTVLSNIFIGVFLVGVAAFAYFSGKLVVIGYPDWILASLLMGVGFFHVGLAKTTWITWPGRIQLVSSGIAALVTHNMIAVLAVAVLTQILFYRRLNFKSSVVENL